MLQAYLTRFEGIMLEITLLVTIGHDDIIMCSHPPMAKIIRVSAGTAPSTPVPRVAAENYKHRDNHSRHHFHFCFSCPCVLNQKHLKMLPSFWKAAGTSMVAGLMKVKKRTLAPS